MQESIVFLVRVQCRRKESSRSLSHLLMSFLYTNRIGPKRIRRNNAKYTAITPFRVIQRLWFQSKAHIPLPISEY